MIKAENLGLLIKDVTATQVRLSQKSSLGQLINDTSYSGHYLTDTQARLAACDNSPEIET
jgi:hypothetical protein